MNITRTTAIATTVAGLALGLTACAPAIDTTDPTSPTGTVAATTTSAADPTTEPAPETTEATATQPATSAGPTEDPTAGDLPTMMPASDGKPGAAACYDENGENRVFDSSVEIEKGAVRAWLCGDAPGGYGTVGPMEPLITDVDAILDDFAALPAPDGEAPQEAAGVYRVVLEYADGSFRTIEGDAQPEGLVWAGDTEKRDGESFYNQVRGRWLDQRLALGGPGEEALAYAMRCPAPQHYVVAHPIEDVANGWICAGNSEETATLPMEPELAQQIAAEIRDNSTPIDASTPAGDTSLSLMVAWGEATVLKLLQGEPGFLWMSDQGAMKYTPTPELEDAIFSAIRNEG